MRLVINVQEGNSSNSNDANHKKKARLRPYVDGEGCSRASVFIIISTTPSGPIAGEMLQA
jgi:hypothetical protein